MKTCMLTYSKLILEKVSFSKELYEREYRKALRKLSESEARQLKEWANNKNKRLANKSVSMVS
ncbi:hypothetical protein WJR50_18995 [Catalinimonas sp. 4WD22]|uniref:hypothetical protein n=1 Tax=Catalinimonas locisalis TaxID=3133978 RepID=UPI0031016A35